MNDANVLRTQTGMLRASKKVIIRGNPKAKNALHKEGRKEIELEF